MPVSFPVTARNTPTRYPERAHYDDTVRQILDEALYCHLTFVVDGEPRVLPTLHVRLGDTLYVHGSTGSGPLLAARRPGGMPVCVAATLLDGLVLSRSHVHHSANYRSVVVHGTGTLLTDGTAKRAVLAALVDKIAAGRSADSRPPTEKELAKTSVLAIPLTDASAKVRDAPAGEEPEDLGLPYWAGVLPLRLVAGEPRPDEADAPPLPPYLLDWWVGEPPHRSAWLTPATLAGDLVRLEPLTMDHADDLAEAGTDPEIWRWKPAPERLDRDGMARYVAGALRQQATAGRVCWAQIEVASGRAVGMTSFYDADPGNRRVEIGYTWLGRPWWRSGLNTEAKLLLMTRAFENLGALRVSWRTDHLNERSQAAIERLGARRDGVLRRHMIRPDGTYRDSVVYSMTDDEWPAARDRLRERLERGRRA